MATPCCAVRTSDRAGTRLLTAKLRAAQWFQVSAAKWRSLCGSGARDRRCGDGPGQRVRNLSLPLGCRGFGGTRQSKTALAYNAVKLSRRFETAAAELVRRPTVMLRRLAGENGGDIPACHAAVLY